MPYGMTGFGRGTAAHPGGAVTVELKSVNNRFLKISTRLPDVFNELESELEVEGELPGEEKEYVQRVDYHELRNETGNKNGH